MPQSIETSRTPTFNHIAMSVPAELLGEQGRGDLLRFFGEVFGWTEMPGMTEDRVRLVLPRLLERAVRVSHRRSGSDAVSEAGPLRHVRGYTQGALRHGRAGA